MTELYTSLNTKYRNNSLSDFGKHLWKFLNNSWFGKTIQSDKKPRDIWSETNKKTRNRLASSISFTGNKYVSDFLRIFEIWKIKQKYSLQPNELHNKTLQNQVNVMVPLMTLWDWYMTSVFWDAIFNFIFVSVSTGTKDFCYFVL